jgi:hypothetical protein
VRALLFFLGGVYIITTVNDAEDKWFSEYVLKSLLKSKNSEGYKFQVRARGFFFLLFVLLVPLFSVSPFFK